MQKNEPVVCGICERYFPSHAVVPVDTVCPQIAERLDAVRSDWKRTGFVCRSDIAEARRTYIQDMLGRERGELNELERTVIDSIARQEMLSRDIDAGFSGTQSFGERMADRVATFGGSWTFIIAFAAVVVFWMGINAASLLQSAPFDPYPFILLNLVLSCLAAMQAPLIMMSQRRQEAKDRLRSENDYRINLKAELEIRELHEKLDHLLIRQWERLTEIQQIQLELMEDIGRERGR